MSFSVIQALVMRYLYLYGRNRVRLVELIFWPVMELLVWGNLSIFLASSHGGEAMPAFIPWLIGGVILWDVLFRAQQAVAMSLLEDVWTRNLLNIFAAPIRPVEYISAAFCAGFLRIGITVCVLSVLAAAGFHFSVFSLHWHLIPFFAMLMMFGWSLGIISSALILRWGQAAESLAWAVPFLVQPVAAVYYPIGVLPGWAQAIGWCLPCTPVFEGMRSVLSGGGVDGKLLIISMVSNVVWMIAAGWLYLRVLRHGRENGTLTKVTTH